MRYFILLLLFASCGSRPQPDYPKVQKATFQKWVGGYGGTKAVQFDVSLKADSGWTLQSVYVNKVELTSTSTVYQNGGYRITTEKAYENPERNPESKNSKEEFQEAPLYHTHQYVMEITLARVGETLKTVRISDWEELESEPRP